MYQYTRSVSIAAGLTPTTRNPNWGERPPSARVNAISAALGVLDEITAATGRSPESPTMLTMTPEPRAFMIRQ